jgi:catalase
MGTPRSFRGMDGAGVHTFKMVNSTGNPVYIKFHWKTKQVKSFFTPEESIRMAGVNADVLLQVIKHENVYTSKSIEKYEAFLGLV